MAALFVPVCKSITASSRLADGRRPKCGIQTSQIKISKQPKRTLDTTLSQTSRLESKANDSQATRNQSEKHTQIHRWQTHGLSEAPYYGRRALPLLDYRGPFRLLDGLCRKRNPSACEDADEGGAGACFPHCRCPRSSGFRRSRMA